MGRKLVTWECYQPSTGDGLVRNVLFGVKLSNSTTLKVDLVGDLHGFKVGASAGEEQMLGKFFILQRAVPIIRNI